MVSRRYRATNTLGTRLDSLDSRVNKVAQRSTKAKADEVVDGAIAENAVGTKEIAPNAVTSEQILPGAVGTSELGAVNQIVSDSNLNLVVPGQVLVNGLPISAIPFTVSDTAPISGGSGSGWFNSSDGSTYIRYDDGSGTQWIEIGGNTGASLPGRNLVFNGNFRTNQRGYVSNAALAPRQYAHDGWQCAGIRNLDTNPEFEAASTGWTNRNGGFQTKSTAQFHGGAASMAITRSGSGDDYVDKTYTTEVGKRYIYSAWVRKTANGATSASRGLFIANSGDFPTVAYSANTNVWERISVAFIAYSTSTVVRFYAATSTTVYVDDVMLTEGSTLWPFFSGTSSDSVWDGTTNASTSTRGPGSGTYTFTTNPQGQTITLTSGAGLMRIIERENAPNGDWVLSWTGTATARFYNVGTAPDSLPAFASSGVTGTLDGLDNVVIEVRAVGGAKTLGKVQFERGTIPTPFEEIPLSQEILLCTRNYVRLTAQANEHLLAVGTQPTTTSSRIVLSLPTPMRIIPTIRHSGLEVSNNNNFRTAVTSITYSSTRLTPTGNNLSMVPNHAAVGTATAGILMQLAVGGWLEFDAEF